MEGGYDASQLFNGEISELNMWNSLISEKEIQSLASCSSLIKGNTITWNRKYFTINKVDVIEVKDYSLFCKTLKQLVIFPKKITFRRAKYMCNVHGGKMALPHSKEEENDIWSIVNKHKKLCLVAEKNVQEGKAVWLGMKKHNRNWYIPHVDNGTLTEIVNYTNWDSTKCVWEDCGDGNNLCPYIQKNRKWAFGMNEAMCSNLELCTVCSFEETPVFTLKGLCRHDTQLDWNYYFAVNKMHRISSYDGYKTSQLLEKDGVWKFKDTDVSAEYSSDIVIGRHRWKYIDGACSIKNSVDTSLTFSRCNFGDEFTCNSGECISLQKRCNGIDECDDGSDEHGCNLVDIPSSYDKLISPSSFKVSGGSHHLMTHVEIISVDIIDTTKMLIGITFKVCIKWSDGRLNFLNLDTDSKNLISQETTSKLWLPSDNIQHDNAILGEIIMDGHKKVGVKNLTTAMPVNKLDSLENYIYKGSQSQMFIEKRFKIIYSCIFELTRFPFDRHNCNFTMKLDVEKSNSILFTKDDIPIKYQGPKTVGQFEIYDVASETRNDSRSTKFVFSLTIRRFVISQMLSTFLPTFLLWCLGYATLFIEIENFTDRFIGAVTALLVLVSLLSSVDDDLPKTSYFKFIDIWFLWYITNILLIIMFHILISRIFNVTMEEEETTTSFGSTIIDKNTKRKDANTKAIVGFAVSSSVFVIIYFSLTT